MADPPPAITLAKLKVAVEPLKLPVEMIVPFCTRLAEAICPAPPVQESVRLVTVTLPELGLEI